MPGFARFLLAGVGRRQSASPAGPFGSVGLIPSGRRAERAGQAGRRLASCQAGRRKLAWVHVH